MKHISTQRHNVLICLLLVLSILFVMVAACSDTKPIVSTTSLAASAITTHPASQKVEEGNAVTVSVVAAVSEGTLHYQWQTAAKGSTDFTHIAGATDASYTTPILTLADNGVQYRVIVMVTLGTQTSSMTSDIATISVYASLSLLAPIITTPPASQTIGECDTAHLGVVVTPPRKATLSYQWQRAARGTTVFANIAGATSASYTTDTLCIADSGTQYRVVVTASNAAHLTSYTTSSVAIISVRAVRPAAPVITTQPASDTIDEGNTTSLSVVATPSAAGLRLTYQWQRAARGTTVFADMAGATSASYTTDTLRRAEDGMQYRVVVTATSASGLTSSTTSHTASIWMHVAAPVITTHPASQTIDEGNATSLSVVATHPAGLRLTYQWQRAARGTTVFADIAGATSASYTISVLAYSDSGMQYHVVVTATSAAGLTSSTTSHTATLSVLPKIVWTHINGTRQYAAAPANGILMSSVLTRTKKDIRSVDAMPSSVTSIGDGAFQFCRSLISVTIQHGVTSIGKSAFFDCKILMSITIPSSVTSIGDNAFFDCAGLTHITIPSSVTNMGGSAFQGCTGLTSLTIENGVTSIGDNAFQDCTSLTSVTIPGSVTNMGKSAFLDCSGLTSLTIEHGVTSVGGNAFQGCIKLTSITIPSSVTSIGDNAFFDCSGLTSLTIENGVGRIEDAAFQDCTGLTSVTIPGSITSMGRSAFVNCTGLTSLTIENGVTSIGIGTFEDCTGLRSVRVEVTSPPAAGTDVFRNTHSTLNIQVPSASVAAYKAAAGWNTYANKITGY